MVVSAASRDPRPKKGGVAQKSQVNWSAGTSVIPILLPMWILTLDHQTYSFHIVLFYQYFPFAWSFLWRESPPFQSWITFPSLCGSEVVYNFFHSYIHCVRHWKEQRCQELVLKWIKGFICTYTSGCCLKSEKALGEEFLWIHENIVWTIFVTSTLLFQNADNKKKEYFRLHFHLCSQDKSFTKNKSLPGTTVWAETFLP